MTPHHSRERHDRTKSVRTTVIARSVLEVGADGRLGTQSNGRLLVVNKKGRANATAAAARWPSLLLQRLADSAAVAVEWSSKSRAALTARWTSCLLRADAWACQ